jgi:hypothetical protein
MAVAPTNLKVSPTVEGLNLTWGVSGTEGLGGWLVHWRPKTAPVIPWQTAMLPAAARTYTVTSLQVESYEIQVRALSAGGIVSGAGTPEAKPAPPPAPSTGAVWGINSGNQPVDLAALKTLGAKIVRFEVVAGDVSSASAVVAQFRAAGIKLNLLIGFYGGMITAKQVVEWAKFAREHVADLVSIEVGNETSSGYQYGDGYKDQSYKDRARTYATRVGELSLAGTGGVPVLCQADDGGSGSSVWVDEMFAAVPGLPACVGGWVAHTYGPPGIGRLERMLKDLAMHAEVKRPVALTEDGISTDNGRSLSDNYGYPTNVSFDQAGQLLEQHLGKIKAVAGERLGMFFVYQVRDQKNHGESSDREAYFGALTHEGAVKGGLTTAVQRLLAA